MVSDASKKKAAQKKVVSVAVMAAASFNGPDKVANGIAKIQISDWTCTSLQRYSNRMQPLKLLTNPFLGKNHSSDLVIW
ncbi:hypothetical protein AAZX31_01G161500 [Glycine max]|nr:hypothetical protein GYH30_001897 [Glycine max]